MVAKPDEDCLSSVESRIVRNNLPADYGPGRYAALVAHVGDQRMCALEPDMLDGKVRKVLAKARKFLITTKKISAKAQRVLLEAFSALAYV
jgi:hypothetical protein